MNSYRDAGTFRQALEERLRRRASGDVGRLRKRLAMERFLLRVQTSHAGRWILKGGLAMELRLREQARATRDIDLGVNASITGSAEQAIVEELRTSVEGEHGDYFQFLTPEGVEQDLEIEGVSVLRLSVDARLAGRTFDKFQLDIASESKGPTPPEEVSGSGLLSFAGLSVERFFVVSRARHLAEKLHALTRPRDVPTRVKDLVDILLLQRMELDHDGASAEVRAVFHRRGTHSIPIQAPAPPANWARTFEAEAARTGLGPMSLDMAAAKLRSLWKDLGLEES